MVFDLVRRRRRRRSPRSIVSPLGDCVSPCVFPCVSPSCGCAVAVPIDCGWATSRAGRRPRRSFVAFITQRAVIDRIALRCPQCGAEMLVASLRKRIPEAAVQGVAAGLHLLLSLPDDCDESAVIDRAQKNGIWVYGAAAYHALPQHAAPALLVGYGGIEQARTDEAVAELARVIADVHRARLGSSRRHGPQPSRERRRATQRRLICSGSAMPRRYNR